MLLSKRLIRQLALTLCLCLAAALPATAASEGGELLSENQEAQAGPAVVVGSDNGLFAEGEAPALTPRRATDGAAEGSAREAAVPASALYYARTLADDTPVYVDDVTLDPLASLAAGEVVLVTGAGFEQLPVAFNANGAVAEGYADAASLEALTPDEAGAWLDAAAVTGVALYADDMNWPLAPLSERSAAGLAALMASANYTDLGNDKVYTINGKEIHASQFPDTGSGHCWSWAQLVYKEVWGFKFSETFKGSSATGMNLLRDLNDAQRLLTPEHLKVFVAHTQPGASLRIAACTSECPQFDNDGLGCGHKGHSLIIVDKTADGVITMDSHSNSQHTRFYSWQGFCNAWKGYSYVKYIKWPGAPALASSQVAEDGNPGTTQPSTPATVAVTGVSLNLSAAKLLEGADFALTATVYPSDATDKTLSWSSSDASVATVRNGVITGVAPGQAVITASAANGAATARCVATVVASNVQKTLGKTGSNGTVKLVPGMKLKLIPKFATSRGWKFKSAGSSNTACATLDVSTGVVTALAEGTATIAILTKNNKKATLTVKVIDPYKATKVKLNKKGTVKLKKGKTLQLKATVSPSTAVTGLTWKSSKPSVASVDENGLVTALKKGSCYIGVGTDNGKYAKVKITVP